MKNKSQEGESRKKIFLNGVSKFPLLSGGRDTALSPKSVP
jgi:hypothetical protein